MNLKIKNVILVAVLVLPFGLVALALWKARDLLKKGEKDEPIKPE